MNCIIIELRSDLCIDSDPDNLEETDEINDSDKDFEPPKKKTRSAKKKHFMNEAICSALDRYKVSSRAATHILIPVIEALGLNPNDFVINHTSLHEKRTKARTQSAKEIRDNFEVVAIYSGHISHVIPQFMNLRFRMLLRCYTSMVKI